MRPGECGLAARAGLLAAYIAAAVTALANPAGLDYDKVYLMGQTANLAVLALLGFCRGKWAEVGAAAALAAGMLLTEGSRWDSTLFAVGAMVILQDAFFQLLPREAGGRAAMYALFLLLVFPALAGLPHLLRPRTVDDATMARAAEFATLAYAPPPGAEIVEDAETDTTALLVAADGDVYLAFRGTSSRRDWKTNADVLSAAVPEAWGCGAGAAGMRAHRGFARAFGAVAPRLLEALRDRPFRRLVVCGHSLGGALATLAGAWACCAMPDARDRVAVVSFGAPQAGDAAFVDFFNDVVPASARVVTPMDPVPRSLSAQMVHVKGYVPAGAWSLATLTRAHSMSTYRLAVSTGRGMSTVAAFVPAILAAGAIVAYLGWLARAARAAA